MARAPVSVFKRPLTKKGCFSYCIKIWDEALGQYKPAVSAKSAVKLLQLDPERFSPTSRTGARLIGEELLKRGGSFSVRKDPLFVDYCELIWDWDRSPYIAWKRAKELRIGREHVYHNQAYVSNYLKPAFPALRLTAVRTYMLEAFILDLKRSGNLSNRSINAIIDSFRTPLNEAVRTGLITVNPAAGIQKFGCDSREKGLPSEDEIRALCALSGLDKRIKVAIALGLTCGLRIGEVQALTRLCIEGNILKIARSWGKIDGIKVTKTGKVRVVPLLPNIKAMLLELSDENPHGKDGFLIYGNMPDKPLDVRSIERGFYRALELIEIYEDERRERNLSFHSLRHFANTRLRGAVSDNTLRKLTGHSTEAMTDHYDHTTEFDILELAKAQESRILPFFQMAVGQ